jgi:REP element-mobilizing transposase RayT
VLRGVGVALWAYCLMPNHIHLICVPGNGQSLAAALGRTHADYARHFNIEGRSCGHGWQARYFSCPLEGVHCWQAMAYVERNPVRAGLAAQAADYRWSGAAAHTGVAAEAMWICGPGKRNMMPTGGPKRCGRRSRKSASPSVSGRRRCVDGH